MKEQILQLEPHDDFNSARDKIGWAQAARVLLVWPDKGRVLSRRLDLVLLQRHAGRLGAQLALITGDPAVREQARALGLPVFDSLDTSRQRRWRGRLARPLPGQTSARPRLDRGRLRPPRSRWQVRLPGWAAWITRGLVFALGAAGALALAVALGPAAQVTVIPASHPVSLTLALAADPTVSEIAEAVIPARVAQVEVEASGQTATSGSAEVPSTAAVGTVIFTSLDGTVTTVPAGTGVRTTSGTAVRFRTTRAVTLEARVGATAAAEVSAADLGPIGNVAAGQINAIDGPLGLQVAVTNPAPAAGGGLSLRAAVTAADRERLRQELLRRLETDALSAIVTQLQPGEFLAANQIALADTVAETFDLAEGEQADVLRLTLRLAFTGLVVGEPDAERAAQAALVAAVPAGEALEAGSARFERFSATTLDDAGRAHFTLQASGVAVPIIAPSSVRELVAGLPVPQAQLRLASALPLSGQPVVTVSPPWWARLPYLPFRIGVVVVGAER
ncbi:MAG: hypothetical protein IT317_07580 [Anaerolineales bacterium]|nr:hypothetical protein [Anaerolineales bacterium]